MSWFWGCVQCSNADHNVGGDWSLQILGSSWYKSSPFTSWDKSSIDILLCMLQLQMNGMLRCVTTMHGRYEFMHTQRTCSECTPAAVAHSDNNGELIICFGNKDMSSVNVIHAADLLPPGTAPNYTIVLKDTKSCNKQQTAVRYRCAAISCYWRRGDGKKFSEHWRKTTWPAQNASIAENEIWNIWSTCKYDCACVNLFACHN